MNMLNRTFLVAPICIAAALLCACGDGSLDVQGDPNRTDASTDLSTGAGGNPGASGNDAGTSGNHTDATGGSTGTGGTGGQAGSAGTGTGGASGTGGGGSTGGGPGTGGGGAGGSAGSARTRLVVASKTTGVTVWDDADKIDSDVAASFVLSDGSVAAGATAFAVASGRLFVGTKNAASRLVVFDSAGTMSASSSPAASIPDTNFVAPMTNGIDSLRIVGQNPMLWAGSFMAGLQWFPQALSLSDSSTTKANLTHAFFQTPGFAYDQVSDRAFVGQISGAGILAWNSVSTLAGTPPLSFTAYKKMAAWTMQVHGDRLYAGGNYSGGSTATSAVAVWNNASTFSSSRDPDLTLTSGIGKTAFMPYLTVTPGDVLLVVLQTDKVLGWVNASTLAAETTPSFTLSTGLVGLKKAVVDLKGRLYVLDATGIVIYSGFPASLTFVTKLTNVASGSDLAVLE